MTEMPSSSPTSEGTATAPPGVSEELRLLRRSQTDRVIAGVLGGLGQRLGVDPVILRVATAVLALFGGVGILLYALAWLFMPAEGESASVLEQAIGRREVRDASAVPLALALGAGVFISGSVILGASWNGRVLLVLAGVGIFLLLRRRAVESAAPPPGPSYAPPPYAGSHPDGPYGDAPPAGPPGTAAWSSVAGTADDAVSDGRPASAAADQSSTRYDETIPAEENAGRGWPEGPDWGQAQPEPSPYEDLYLQRDDAPRPEPREENQRSPLGRLTFFAALISVGLLAMADAVWDVEPGALYVAAPLAIVAIGLLIGTWFGRSRGLITLGVLLAIALVPATFFGRWDLTTGPSYFATPVSVDEIPSEPLTHGMGPMDYDLSALELSDEDDVSVTLQLGMGPVTVLVPEEADVVVNGSVTVGVINAFGESVAGFGREATITDNGPDGPGGGQIELNIQLGMGPIDVTRVETGANQ